MIDPQKAIQKLRRPPAVQNWVKNMYRRRDDTARSLYDFAINGPRHSLKPVVDIVRQIVVDDISDELAFKCVDRIKNPLVKRLGTEVLKALLPYIRKRGWKGIEIFREMEERFPVAANVDVPVRPTFVLNEDGKIVPYFVICWARIGLDDYQKRILSTIISEAILSLEEFEDSDAVIIFVHRHKFSKTEREVVEWRLSAYPVLSEDEKEDLFDRYDSALADAERMILENLG